MRVLPLPSPVGAMRPFVFLLSHAASFGEGPAGTRVHRLKLSCHERALGRSSAQPRPGHREELGISTAGMIVFPSPLTSLFHICLMASEHTFTHVFHDLRRNRSHFGHLLSEVH